MHKVWTPQYPETRNNNQKSLNIVCFGWQTVELDIKYFGENNIQIISNNFYSLLCNELTIFKVSTLNSPSKHY